jgi:hypothetical protein
VPTASRARSCSLSSLARVRKALETAEREGREGDEAEAHLSEVMRLLGRRPNEKEVSSVVESIARTLRVVRDR